MTRCAPAALALLVPLVAGCDYPDFDFVHAPVAHDASLDATADTSGELHADATLDAPEAEVCATTVCGGKCVDTASDPMNCGACGNGCPPGASCESGSCKCPGATATICGDTCVELAEDPRHCNSCTKGCGTDGVCNGKGACWCRERMDYCASVDQCRNLQTDPRDCGGCDVACNGTQGCARGACVDSCPSDLAKCPIGVTFGCVDFDNDDQNCGSCGKRCGQGEVCAGGACRTFAPAVGCDACPCDSACAALFPDGAACCKSFFYDHHPICVRGSSCP